MASPTSKPKAPPVDGVSANLFRFANSKILVQISAAIDSPANMNVSIREGQSTEVVFDLTPKEARALAKSLNHFSDLLSLGR